MQVTLRPARPIDQSFLQAVYASTRVEEMTLVDWPSEQKTAFLQMQFNAQAEHYRAYYPSATYQIILRDDLPMGRLIVNRSPHEILLMDIALLPEYRNTGIGTGLIRELQDESMRSGRALHLHVEIFNPALRLYQRLGFRSIGESGIYLEMEWNGPAQRTSRPFLNDGQDSASA